MIFRLLMLLTLFCFQAKEIYGLTTRGDQIIGENGQVIELKGVNWFGFNNQSTMVDGLWSSNNLSGDFATVVYRMQLLGFNAVRLPFSFKDLYELGPRDYNHYCQIASQDAVQKSVTNPNVGVPAGKTIPAMVYPVPQTPNTCNAYLPNTTTLKRFLWVVNFFAKNGFYVLIDNHLREDSTFLDSPDRWVQSWSALMTEIAKDPVSKKMVMADLLNEPDNYGIQWEGNPSLSKYYIAAMDALYPINPEALFFIEGAGQGNIGANWGDGFATDPNLIRQNGLSDPNPFFQALFSKPYLNQVVISPHVYPPSVTGANANFSGSGLYNRLTQSFGYLTQNGYCQGSTCKTFPIAIGEFGSRFQESNDLQMLNDFASYLNNKNQGADGKHKAIPHWFYWSWNPNSSDTGGIVEDDWMTIVWKKIDYLALLGLKPWYATNTPPPPPTKKGSLCMKVLPVAGLTKESLKTITVGGYTFELKDFNQIVCQVIPVGSYVVTFPEIVVGNTRYTAPSANVNVSENGTVSIDVAYKATVNPVKTGSLCVTIKPLAGLTKALLKPIVVGAYTFDVKDFNVSVCKTVPVGSYTIAFPEIVNGQTRYTAPSKTIAVIEGKQSTVEGVYKASAIVVNSNIVVEVEESEPWMEGNVYKSAMNFTFKNMGTTSINVPWKVKIYNASYVGVDSVWNLSFEGIQNSTVQGTVREEWQTLQPGGANSVNVGMVVSSKGGFTPTAIKVNDIAVQIIKK